MRGIFLEEDAASPSTPFHPLKNRLSFYLPALVAPG
jgi:hypothetical protein